MVAPGTPPGGASRPELVRQETPAPPPPSSNESGVVPAAALPSNRSRSGSAPQQQQQRPGVPVLPVSPLPSLTPTPATRAQPPTPLRAGSYPPITSGSELQSPVRTPTTPTMSTAPAALSPTPAMATPALPPLLAAGVPMLKVSSKKIKPVIVQLSPTTITWPSMKGGKVEIKSIRELRLGQSPTEQHDSRRWLTIVYVRSGQWKVVHFIAHTDDVYAAFVKALRSLVAAASDHVVPGVTEGTGGSPPPGKAASDESSTHSVASDGSAAPLKNAVVPASDHDLVLIRQLWPANQARLDQNTATRICAQLGLPTDAETVAKYEPLDINAVHQLVRDLQIRPELDDLYRVLGGPLNRGQVGSFLHTVQKEHNLDAARVNEVFDRYAAADSTWTATSLATFLASPDNVPKQVQDMTRPLPEYFIASSHNTYLVAEQWRGASTVEGYVRVLLAGCRCVEIDIHNGDSGPVVYHGKTLTSSVPVRDVCVAIKKYAFVSSPYPIIISLEVRCDVQNQDKLAAIIVDVFGDLLVKDIVPEIDGIPSPEDLKGRILIKAKAPKPPAAPRTSTHLSVSPPSTSRDSTDSTTESESSSHSSSLSRRIARRLSISSSPSDKAPKAVAPVSKHLASLPVYTTGVRYAGFSKLVTYDSHHIFSVSERTANRILKEGSEADWIKHNFTHLVRVYPKGVRLGSSNFDPQPYWAAGAQLVAINYQTLDWGSLVNHAMFHSPVGYVLKPQAMRHKHPEQEQRYRLSVRLISAQRLPPAADLYVEATLGESSAKTRVAAGKSLSRRWDDVLPFEFDAKPSHLAITFLHLEIKSKGQSGIVAQWMRSVHDAPRGYRYLPLDDQTRSRFLFSTLFVRIDVEVLGIAPSA